MIKQIFLLSAYFSLFTITLQAQELNCGTTLEDNAAIKAQMLENRRTISREEIDFQRNKRSITYIPVAVHLIADAEGKNGPDPQSAVMTVCNLNIFFEHMNLQFYLHPTNPVNYLNNNTVFNDGYSGSSIAIMGMNKINNALNIFIGEKVSVNVAGYYSRNTDIVFIRKREANLISTTLTHELGHFFTLPHTFYGWENINYDSEYGASSAPTRVNNNVVEYKARTGSNANCSTAADGFCDTEADYYSFRVACNHNTTVLDPIGERLMPNSRNYMSYFNDVCQSEFSNEQQDAIWASITNRRWLNFAEPNLTPLVSDFASNMYPIADDSIISTNSVINFHWASTPNAIGYIFQLERLFLGQPIGIIEKVWIPATNIATVQHSSSITLTSSYKWSITPVTSTACNSIAETFNFHATISDIPSSIDNIDEVETKLSININPNPVQKGSNITANINSSISGKANIKIYSLDGRLAWQQRIDLFANDNNYFHFESTYFAAGMYILQVQSELGVQQSKFIVQ